MKVFTVSVSENTYLLIQHCCFSRLYPLLNFKLKTASWELALLLSSGKDKPTLLGPMVVQDRSCDSMLATQRKCAENTFIAGESTSTVI
jgi:hypothetical protein